MLAGIQALETKLTEVWHELDGEAREELQQLLTDAKAEDAALKEQLAPLLTQFNADVKAAVAAAEPQVIAAVEALLEKLLASALPMLGKGPASE